jgi:NAD-dependent dihydropyrimidine dehydrogenase PreA subunit
MQGIIGKCLRVREIKRKRCILACPMYGARRIHLNLLFI